MEPGVAISQSEVEQLLQQHKPAMLFICHGAHRAVNMPCRTTAQTMPKRDVACHASVLV